MWRCAVGNLDLAGEASRPWRGWEALGKPPEIEGKDAACAGLGHRAYLA